MNRTFTPCVSKAIAILLLAAAFALSLIPMPSAWAGEPLAVNSSGISSTAQSEDDYENATDIALNTWYSGDNSEGVDGDSSRYWRYYRFTLSQAGRLTLQESSENGADFWIQDEAVNLERPLGNQYTVDLTAGVYYIYAYTTGSYRFKLEFESAQESFPERQGGSNNSTGTASTIALGTTYRGQFAENDSVDYYSFKTTGSGVIRITMSSKLSRVDYKLRDVYGGWIASNTSYADSNTDRQSLSWTYEIGKGEFLLQMESSSTGPYTFNVTELPSIAGATIGPIAAGSYTGKKLTPTFSVMLGNVALARNVDYSAKFSNNKDAGTASVVLTGQGNYTGSRTVTFKIDRADIGKASVSALKALTYSGKSNKPSLTVTHGSNKLELNSDYTVRYTSNVNAGTAKAIISGKGNYTGTKTVSFKIARAAISKAKFSSIKTMTYTGAKQKPAAKVTFGGKKLKQGRDYTVKYANNVNAGKAHATIVGKGNFTGKKTLTFTIAPANVRNAKAPTLETRTFTGQAYEPTVKATFGGKKLKQGRDYTVRYTDNVNAGKAHVTIVGKGNYTGKKTLTFTIKRASIAKAKAAAVKAQVYTGEKIEPLVKLTQRNAKNKGGKGEAALALDRDYTVKYKNNTNAGKASVTIIGTGNYTGTKTLSFTIKKAEQDITVDADTWYANANSLEYESVSASLSYWCEISDAHGAVTLTKVSVNKLPGCFSVAKNGTVTVAKGTPEGVYRLKIRVKAAGNRNYKPGTVTFTTTIEVEAW